MGEPTDGRSDLYSLGVVGYYTLTGQLPFEGATTVEVMAAHIARRPKPMQGFAPQVPRKLAGAVEKCLEKDRERRWATGEQFAEAVDATFEQPREIPALLRVWLKKNDTPSSFRFVFMSLIVFGPFSILIRESPLLAMLIATPLAVALNLAPEAVNVRRLLRHGFTLADMREVLEIHTVQRQEEAELDSAFKPISDRALGVTAIACFGVAALATLLLVTKTVSSEGLGVTLAVLDALAAAVGVGCIAGLIGAKIWFPRPKKFGQQRLAFWRGKWGERFAKLAGLGLKHGATAAWALPQHTEVALGRATDALFQALPKNVRRDLKTVPETVRRLERDAGSLRDSLDKLDELLLGANDPALQRQRDLAAGRFSTTVTALENIRLGLLRLQLGSAPVAQVTEALEAASRIGREIDFALDAEDEIGDVLKPKRVANRDPERSPV